jgi:hypothetical protein
MKIHARLVAVLLSCVLAGCVSIQPKTLAPDDGAALRNKTLVVDQYQISSFAAITPGKAIFGAIGGALMVTTGNQFVEENEIQDPAKYIGNQVADRLASRLGIVVNQSNAESLNSNSVDAISARYQDSNLVLDSQTINWSYAYYPTHWDSYRLIYSVRMRLIDTRAKEVLAEAFCARNDEYSDDAPSHRELTANGGEWIKNRLIAYAGSCTDELTNKILGVSVVTEDATSDQSISKQVDSEAMPSH